MPDTQLISGEYIEPSWKDSIYRQREELERLLREPLALLAGKCVPVWADRDGLNTVLMGGFSSSQVTIWAIDDPLRYRILDHEVLKDPDICLVYPSRPYPEDATIPRTEIARILAAMRGLRTVDTTIYLRTASVNIFSGMVSLTLFLRRIALHALRRISRQGPPPSGPVQPSNQTQESQTY